METNVGVQKVSMVDALLAIYRQQDERVRRDFLMRVRQEDSLLDYARDANPRRDDASFMRSDKRHRCWS